MKQIDIELEFEEAAYRVAVQAIAAYEQAKKDNRRRKNLSPAEVQELRERDKRRHEERKNSPEYKEYQRAYRELIASDPDRRERKLAYQRDWYANKSPEYRAEQSRKSLRTHHAQKESDPTYLERRAAYQRMYRKRKREEQENARAHQGTD